MADNNQAQSQRLVAIATSSTLLTLPTLTNVRRTLLAITNTSATTVTLSFGDAAAVANTGIILTQNQSWVESDDVAFRCWQGAIQAIGSGASNVSISERYAEQQ